MAGIKKDKIVYDEDFPEGPLDFWEKYYRQE